MRHRLEALPGREVAAHPVFAAQAAGEELEHQAGGGLEVPVDRRARPWLAALLLAAAACSGGEPGLRLWACPETAKVGPDGRLLESGLGADFRRRNAVFDAQSGAIRLAGARGETLAFQLQIEARGRPARGVEVAVEADVPPERAVARFALFRAHYTEVAEPSQSPGPSLGPGAYPDALVPFELPGFGAPFAIAAGRTQGVWVDVAIDPGAPPGRHPARVLVREADGPPRVLRLELEVFDFALPAVPSFRINVATYDHGKGGHAINSGFGHRFDVWSPAFRAIEQRFYRMARAHRHTLHARHYDLPVRAQEGELAIDWTRFDARFGALFDGSAFADGLPLDYWEIDLRHNLPPERFGGPASEAWGRAAAAYARSFAEHFRERGWARTRLVAFPVDEPSTEGAFAEAELVGRALRASAPGIAFRIDLYKALSRPLIERFAPLVDIWAVQGSYFRGLLPELLALRARGAQVWFYQGSAPAVGPEILDAEGVALRTWGWIGWRYGLDAADLWECCKWQLTPDIWTDPRNNPWPSNGAGVLYYPGARVGLDGPIPSLRLKVLRRGQQDYEYLALAERRAGRAAAEEVAGRVLRGALDRTRRSRGEPGDWSHHPDDWVAARLALARLIRP